MNENRRNIEEDEIDLVELFRTLLKRKWFIVVFTSIVTLSAIVFTYIKTPVYEVKSNVKIGYIGENLLGDPNTINKELRIVFNVDDKLSSKNIITSTVTSISVNKKIQNFLEIKTEANSNEKALEKNKEVVEYLKNMHKIKIDNYINNKKNLIKDTQRALRHVDEVEIRDVKREIQKLKIYNVVAIERKIKFLKNKQTVSIKNKINNYEQKLDEYTDAIKELNLDLKNSDSALKMILSVQMLNYQNMILNSQNKIEDLKIALDIIEKETIPNLEIKKLNIINETIKKLEENINITLKEKKLKLQEKIENLKYLINNVNIENSKVVGDYILHDYPIKPKKKLIVVVAFVTGLILSIFLVFFIEFIQNIKRKESKE